MPPVPEIEKVLFTKEQIAERIKEVAAEISERYDGKDLKLIGVLNRLVSAGNSVLVIEHNLDVIKTCDYLIDMGPEGGDGGGRVVATGTPEQVAKVKESHTGRYLQKVLR